MSGPLISHNKLGLNVFCLLLVGVCGNVFAQSAIDYPSMWDCDSHKFNWYCDQQDAKPPVREPVAPLGGPPAQASQPLPQRIEIADIKTT